MLPLRAQKNPVMGFCLLRSGSNGHKFLIISNEGFVSFDLLRRGGGYDEGGFT